MTDAKLIEKFANVRSIFEIRGYINSMITAVNDHASKTRKALFEAHDSGVIDEDIFDGLYVQFTQSYIKYFRKEVAKCLATVDKIITDKSYNTYAKYYKDDMQILYKNPDRVTYELPRQWMKAYTNVISNLAEVMSGIYRATHGKADEVRAEVEEYVS